MSVYLLRRKSLSFPSVYQRLHEHAVLRLAIDETNKSGKQELRVFKGKPLNVFYESETWATTGERIQ